MPLSADLPDIELLSEGRVGSRLRLERLIDRFVQLQRSAENERRRTLWLAEDCARDQWHGTPLPDRFRDNGVVPFTVDLQYPIWQRLWPFYDLQEVFTSPSAFLDFQLTRKIAQFQWLPDDTYLDNHIFIYLGAPFEPSLFGMDVQYFSEANPAVVHAPVILSRDDLMDRPRPDFYQDGLMPVAHRMWSEIGDILRGRIDLQFVEWLRSPFGIATDVRGFDSLLVDMMIDPDFFHSLIDYIVQSQVAWYDEWSRFVGRPPEGISIFNDELDGSLLSANHYLENIHPHEVQLNEAFGLVTYYHSCGNLAPMMPHIDRLPNIRMLDLGPYTEKAPALRSLRKRYLYELRVQPERDLLQASSTEMRAVLEQHVSVCRQCNVGAVTFRASGMQPVFADPLRVIGKIREWIDVMRDIANREAESGGHQGLFAGREGADETGA